MIVFVGDKPSKKNVDPNIPFVGTMSYKRLLEWIWEMDIDISEVKMYNKDSLWLHNLRHHANIKDAKVICLGNASSKLFEDNNVPHFKLPHPSGLNRKCNDKKWLKKELNKCKRWLSE